MTGSGSVAVLSGGVSAERDISLRSGDAVLRALQVCGVEAHAVDPAQAVLPQFAQGKFNRAFIALHGAGGEDGSIQGALDVLRIPYTGSGVLASALSFDKFACKCIWRALGLPTPDFCMVNAGETAPVVGFDPPWVVKPLSGGSSHGISRVEDMDGLAAAVAAARAYDQRVLVERWVDGTEYTAAILHRKVLPMVGLKTPRAFYDYVAKYESTDTEYICPSDLDAAHEARLAQLALAAFDALQASGWGRIDFILDNNGGMQLLELNTVPGMTEHSLVPKAARVDGLSFEELVLEVLRSSDAGAAVAGMNP